MHNEFIYVTREAAKAEAFVAGSDNTPKHIKEILSTEGKVLSYKHRGTNPLLCEAGDFVFYGCDRGEGPFLRLISKEDYFVKDGFVYERQPIYIACKVDESYPSFLTDIDIQFNGNFWVLKSPRLHIKVHLGDYWIRDIDPMHRYSIPVVSVIEKSGFSFDKFWRCDTEGNLIELLFEYDARNYLSAPTR